MSRLKKPGNQNAKTPQSNEKLYDRNIEKQMTVEMKEDLDEVYRDAMDYGSGYFKIEDWNKKHGEVKWNVGEFDGFYIADGIIQVR